MNFTKFNRYLFLNWLCGLESLGIASNIRDTTIIIATDEQSESIAKNLNFSVIRSDWLPFKLDKNAAVSFLQGPFKITVALQIIYTFDVISLGYNVIQQDIDVVWFKDVRNYFDNSFLDIEMPCDGRVDWNGPGNTGFIHIRSNCKTKIFMQTLVQYIGLIMQHKNDQPVWNAFLMEYDFRQILFQILPPDKFVNGNQWSFKKSDMHRFQMSNDIWMAHASWTGDHSSKITKLKVLQAWYLNQTCKYYQPNMIPKHKKPEFELTPNMRNWKYPELKPIKWWQ